MTSKQLIELLTVLDPEGTMEISIYYNWPRTIEEEDVEVVSDDNKTRIRIS